MLYLALIAGSLFYLSRTILEFRAYEMSILPEVESSEKKIDRLEDLIESEVHKLADVKLRVASIRGVREDLMREVEDVNGKLLAEQTHYQALFLDVQKRQFRGALARGRKLVLR